MTKKDGLAPEKGWQGNPCLQTPEPPSSWRSPPIIVQYSMSNIILQYEQHIQYFNVNKTTWLLILEECLTPMTNSFSGLKKYIKNILSRPTYSSSLFLIMAQFYIIWKNCRVLPNKSGNSSCHLRARIEYSSSRGSHRDVVYLGWPIAHSFMSPKAGGGGLRGLSQRVWLGTWSPNKLWRSNSIFNLWYLGLLVWR